MRVPYAPRAGKNGAFAIFGCLRASAFRRARASATGSGGLYGLQSRAAGHRAERDHEGTTVGQADVREVQDHSPSRARAGHLLEPPSQAAAGVGLARWLASQ